MHAEVGEDFQEYLQRLLGTVLPPMKVKLPFSIAHRRITIPAKGWGRVYYQDTEGKRVSIRNPAVVALIEAKEGWITKPTVEVREGTEWKIEYSENKIILTYATVEIPKITLHVQIVRGTEWKTELTKQTETEYTLKITYAPVEIPKPSQVSFEANAKAYVDGLYEQFKNKLPLGMGALAWPVFWFVKTVAGYVGKLLDTFAWGIFYSHIDENNRKLSEAITNQVSNIMNSIAKTYTVVVKHMDMVRDNTNKHMQDATRATAMALADTIEATVSALWDMLQYTRGLRLTPAEVRNVRSDSFDVYSPGANTVLHYIAIGLP